MTETQTLFHAAVTLALLGLLTHIPSLMENLGRRGILLLGFGSLVPLLDMGLRFFINGDRIAYLAFPSLLAGWLYGALLLAAIGILIAFLSTLLQGLLAFGLLMAGFFFQQFLSWLTPAGILPRVPFDNQSYSLPVLPQGHLPLLIVLALALLMVETLPGWRRRVLIGTAMIGGIYLLIGGFQYTWFSMEARAMAGQEAQVIVEPSNPWMTRWVVAIATDEHYRVQQHGLDHGPMGEGDIVPRWNDQSLMISLLGDPMIRAFYFQRFRHPVAQTENKRSGISLQIQELEDVMPSRKGPTLSFEMELPEMTRYYKVAHFH